MAAARQIRVDTVGDSRKFALHCSSFLDFKIVRCVSDNLIEINVVLPVLPKKAERARIFNKGGALMKLSLSILALVAAAAMPAAPVFAQNYPWCAIYSGGAVGGGTNCGFVSYEQCMATARGLGSFCYRNTQFVPPPGPHSPRRHYPY